MKFIEVHTERNGYLMVNIDAVYMIGAGDGTDENWATAYYYTEYAGGFLSGAGKVSNQGYITKKQFEEIKKTMAITGKE